MNYWNKEKKTYFQSYHLLMNCKMLYVDELQVCIRTLDDFSHLIC